MTVRVQKAVQEIPVQDVGSHFLQRPNSDSTFGVKLDLFQKHLLNVKQKQKIMYTTYSELVVFMYGPGKSINN